MAEFYQQGSNRRDLLSKLIPCKSLQSLSGSIRPIKQLRAMPCTQDLVYRREADLTK